MTPRTDVNRQESPIATHLSAWNKSTRGWCCGGSSVVTVVLRSHLANASSGTLFDQPLSRVCNVACNTTSLDRPTPSPTKEVKDCSVFSLLLFRSIGERGFLDADLRGPTGPKCPKWQITTQSRRFGCMTSQWRMAAEYFNNR